MTIVIDPTCSTCHGSGTIMGGDEYHDCPACRLRSHQLDAEERAAEEWKALRDSGADELTLRAMAGDR